MFPMFFFLQRLGRSHLSWNHLWLCLFFLPEDTGRRSWSITLTCCTNTTTSRTLDSHFWVVSVRQWLQVTCLVWAWSGEGFGSGPTEKSESSDQMTKLWKHTEVPDDVLTWVSRPFVGLTLWLMVYTFGISNRLDETYRDRSFLLV